MARRTRWGTTTWYVIASAAGARIIEHRQGSRRVSVVADHPCRPLSECSEIITSFLGRRRSRPLSPTVRQLARDTLLADVATDLKRGRDRGVFDRIVLVGPPGMLSRLHLAMDAGTRALVARELPHDLSMIPVQALQRKLAALLGR